MAKVHLFAVEPVQHGHELVPPGKKFTVDTEAEAEQLIASKSASREKPDAAHHAAAADQADLV